MANDVKLTFAGDTSNLEKAFSKVGSGAENMDKKVHGASKAVEEHGGKMEAMGEKADGSETALIGVHDIIDGTATIMQGPGKAGMSAYIQGWADLAGGVAPLILMLAQTNLAMIKNGITAAATAVWTGILKVGTLAWAGAQWVLNAAMTANPIGLIIVGIILLIGIIVLIATKTTWFQTIWKAVWGFIKSAAKAVADWFTGPFVGFFVSAWDKLKSGVSAIKNFYVNGFKAIVSFVSGVPGKIFGFFSSLPGRFRSIGTAIINGIINGIKSMVGHLASVAANAAKSALNAAKKFLHISSPSGVFRDQVGKNMVLGVAQGITRNMGVVKQAVNQIPTSIDGGATRSTVDQIRSSGTATQSNRPQLMRLVVDTTGSADIDKLEAARIQRLARDGRLKGLVVA